MQTQMSNAEVHEAVQNIINRNDGIDPITQAKERLHRMGHSELEKLCLIACNTVGKHMNTEEDFASPLEALNFFILGIQEVFTAYDNALTAKLEQEEGFNA